MREQAEQGASSVEYSLLAALAGILIGSVLTLGQSTQASYQDSCTKISAAMGTACGP